MKILNIIHDSIVDGSGLRTVIFFAGCSHRCDGCHNAESWNIDYGTEYSEQEVIAEVQSNRMTKGVTLSGGDPFLQSNEASNLAKKLKELGYNIWTYTGYTYEEIMNSNNRHSLDLLRQSDVLVDGRFDKDKLSLDGRFVGSTNQRVISVKGSLKASKVVLQK